MDWGEEKKADHKSINFCGDAEEFRICFNVVMALYMVFGSISTSGQRVRTCKEEEEDEHIT